MYRHIPARIADDDYNYLKTLADHNGIRMGDYIADAVAEYVRRNKREAATFQVIIEADKATARTE